MSEDRVKKGIEIQGGSLGRDMPNMKVFRELSPMYAQSIEEWCWGTIWDQPVLDIKTRELIVIATSIGQDDVGEVAMHTRGALNRGASREEIIETIVQCAPYVGLPKTNHALLTAKEVFDQWEERDDWKAV
ncbi:MAG: carboxymuconolactone decarboxylase family protein [Nitrospinaceae bacterium]|nr:carboxymuconolactone decarboxylase family protein [Nitrospinaceae bacterium]MBT3432365.1 carboxymuconolactone decarboxylase family protein [Nitrospinaceae bacterium]MBT3823214.1 carboxymuconolactone decarboxylase family protein [Nitrospinaceae bacterium]MBT4092782.1 carboxymuconolactone decarboxylase family protein [Nitrospinaceae bacterium]MBT4431227.1 carboxymuconolactone decarboxylase family protein [Nitrospinaceae bacterium]